MGLRYNEWGAAVALYNTTSAREYWRIQEFSQFGQPKRVAYANGTVLTRTYEPTTGNLESSMVKSQDGSTTYREEHLSYDARGLLDSVREQLSGPARTFTHDDHGRLSRESWKGTSDTYTYDDLGNLRTSPTAGTLFYDDPRSITAVTSTSDGRFYEYDDLGNQTVRRGTGVPGGRQEIEYTLFDLPKELRVGPEDDPTTERVYFRYGASNERVAKESPSKGTQTIYVGDSFRRYKHPSGFLEYVARVPSPSGVGIELVTTSNGIVERYGLEDHLGSPDNILDGAMQREARSYAPFGQSSSSTTTRTNFTGHEDDLEFGLINMKGRIYDPGLGRFLTPDPLVQAPASVESWNRHSYVMNSPMSATDPSGFQSFCLPPPTGQQDSLDAGCTRAGPLPETTPASGTTGTYPTGGGGGVVGGGFVGSAGTTRGRGNASSVVAAAKQDAFGQLAQQTAQAAQSAQLGTLASLAALMSSGANFGRLNVQFAPSHDVDLALKVANSIDGTGTYMAGFGDAISFGISGVIRDAAGWGATVDQNSRTYSLGKWTGVAYSFALGAAGAARGAGAAGSELVTVTRWGRPGLQPGDWVQKGGNTLLNWIKSGKGQPSWFPGGNLPASRAAGETFKVAKEAVRFPRAEGGRLNPLNWVKYLLGQRQYLP